jgi:transcriptional regulator with XRE-family HTH domain
VPGLIDTDEAARRVKAARAYAELTREQLAQRTSLSVKSLKLIEERRRQSTTREELAQIGHACGVPGEFMEIGFQGAARVYSDLQRIFAAVLSQDMPAILAEAERMGVLEAVRQASDGSPPPPQAAPAGASSHAAELATGQPAARGARRRRRVG